MSYVPNVWFWERRSSDITQVTSNVTILKVKIPCLDFLGSDFYICVMTPELLWFFKLLNIYFFCNYGFVSKKEY